MTLETAGVIASIAAIIVDVASICLNLHEQLQRLPSVLDDLQTDVDHLEKILTPLQNAENNQRQSYSRDAREIVNNCHQLRSEFARDVSQWKRDRYIFGYNWKSLYLLIFGQRRMRYVSKRFRDCLSKIGVVASIAAWEMSATTHAQTVDGYVSLVEQMTELSAKLNHLSAKITKIDASEEYQQRICQQQERTNEALEILTVIATTDRNTFPERAAAKYVGGHTAIDNTTAESQTGHDERGTAIDK